MSPVWRDPDTDAWHVFRYQDVATVLASPDFSVRRPEDPPPRIGHIAAMNPPAHQRLRQLVRRNFTPAAVGSLRPAVHRVADELMAEIDQMDRLDVVAGLVRPLSFAVLADVLGIPAADRDLFASWTDDLVFPQSESARRVSATAVDTYLDRWVTRQRSGAGNGLLLDLMGDGLGSEEVKGLAHAVLFAGYSTTVLLLGNILLCLGEYPEAQTALRSQRGLVSSAVEEVLRHSPPVETTFRVAARDVVLGDMLVPAGAEMRFSIMSANHDERRFHRPDLFLPDRRPNPHLSFGKGIHYCLGGFVAKLTASAFLHGVLRRSAWVDVDMDRPPDFYPAGEVNGVSALVLRIEPAGSRQPADDRGRGRAAQRVRP